MELKENYNSEKTDSRELRSKLIFFGVDLDSWGKKGAKTLDELQKEIEEGESVLVEENGELVRKVESAVIGVFYEDLEGHKYKLKEDRQVFADGNVRYRNFPQAVLEKIKRGENSLQAAQRGLKEELGILDELKFKDQGGVYKEKESVSYPGLKSAYTQHKFSVYLNDE